MKWFRELPHEERQAISCLAKKGRDDVMRKYREEELTRQKQRQENNMRRCHERKKAMREKAAREKEHLSHQYLITTVEELKKALQDIDSDVITTSKKKQSKISLIRMQINIRKVLGQRIKIPFSQRGKQRPLAVIIKKLADFIAANPHSGAASVLSDPSSLVGKEILHKFQTDSGEESCFSGIVISYNPENTHEILYDGDSSRSSD